MNGGDIIVLFLIGYSTRLFLRHIHKLGLYFGITSCIFI